MIQIIDDIEDILTHQNIKNSALITKKLDALRNKYTSSDFKKISESDTESVFGDEKLTKNLVDHIVSNKPIDMAYLTSLDFSEVSIDKSSEFKDNCDFYDNFFVHNIVEPSIVSDWPTHKHQMIDELTGMMDEVAREADSDTKKELSLSYLMSPVAKSMIGQVNKDRSELYTEVEYQKEPSDLQKYIDILEDFQNSESEFAEFPRKKQKTAAQVMAWFNSRAQIPPAPKPIKVSNYSERDYSLVFEDVPIPKVHTARPVAEELIVIMGTKPEDRIAELRNYKSKCTVPGDFFEVYDFCIRNFSASKLVDSAKLLASNLNMQNNRNGVKGFKIKASPEEKLTNAMVNGSADREIPMSAAKGGE